MKPAAQLAKLRWKGTTPEDRTKEMTRVALEGWKKRARNKKKASARLTSSEK